MLAPMAAAIVVSAAALAPARAAEPTGPLIDTVMDTVPAVNGLVDSATGAVRPHAKVVGQLARTKPKPASQPQTLEVLPLTSLDGSALTTAAQQLGLDASVPRCSLLAERDLLSDLTAHRATTGKAAPAPQCGTVRTGDRRHAADSATDPAGDLLGSLLQGSLSNSQVGPVGSPPKPGVYTSTPALLGGLPVGLSGAPRPDSPGSPGLTIPYVSLGQSALGS